MDTECVSLLPRVCEVLADSGRSLPDDTSLEKLLDWFTGLNKAGGSLLTTCPCLLEFISTVISNSTSDPAVLSFTIKLTGLMAATEDGFRTLQVRLSCALINSECNSAKNLTSVMMIPCRSALLWTWSSTFSPGMRQGSGMIPAYVLDGSRAYGAC
uniref:BRCA1-associated ATM activator 1 n=1 Tax=Sphaeramia orbicularis TaxID=375764 RepID=A0A673A3K9_9TELE